MYFWAMIVMTGETIQVTYKLPVSLEVGEKKRAESTYPNDSQEASLNGLDYLVNRRGAIDNGH
jgi:hypothetical protein